MSNPFSEHAQNTADYQDMLKGAGDGGATLTLKLPDDVTVDCTFDRIMDDFNLVAGGQSPKLMVEGCKFLASGIAADKLALIRKNVFCVLKPNPDAADVPCKLWMGGLEQGGLIFSFMLVDRNYAA
jgi:hypothetical protein